MESLLSYGQFSQELEYRGTEGSGALGHVLLLSGTVLKQPGEPQALDAALKWMGRSFVTFATHFLMTDWESSCPQESFCSDNTVLDDEFVTLSSGCQFVLEPGILKILR